jgi:molybdate transport system regulatory protein
VIGDGGLRLLQEIEGRGSLLAAARQIGWSYRHAWHYLRQAEQVFGCPLVIPRSGKGLRRGTEFTADGNYLLARLRDARSRVDRSVGTTGPTPEEISVRGRLRVSSVPKRPRDV